MIAKYTEQKGLSAWKQRERVAFCILFKYLSLELIDYGAIDILVILSPALDFKCTQCFPIAWCLKYLGGYLAEVLNFFIHNVGDLSGCQIILF